MPKYHWDLISMCFPSEVSIQGPWGQGRSTYLSDTPIHRYIHTYNRRIGDASILSPTGKITNETTWSGEKMGSSAAIGEDGARGLRQYQMSLTINPNDRK